MIESLFRMGDVHSNSFNALLNQTGSGEGGLQSVGCKVNVTLEDASGGVISLDGPAFEVQPFYQFLIRFSIPQLDILQHLSAPDSSKHGSES